MDEIRTSYTTNLCDQKRKEPTFFPREKMEKVLARFVDEVYSKRCTEIGLKLDVDMVSIPEMEVHYKTYILPQDFSEEEE